MNSEVSGLSASRDIICYCKAHGSYTEVVFSNGLRKVVCKNIKQLETTISDLNYIRCHNSFIVNSSAIKKIDLKDLVLELDDGALIPISRRRIKNIPDFKKLFKI